MKKLIKLSDTHYIVVDNSEIKANEWFYSPALNRHQIFGHDSVPKDRGFKKITHSTEPLENVKTISLSEVEELIYGYSVEKRAFSQCGRGQTIVTLDAFKDGFKAHQELVKDKLFTVEDIEKAIDKSIDLMRNKYSEFRTHKSTIIKSLLPKTEWDIKFDEQDKIKLL